MMYNKVLLSVAALSGASLAQTSSEGSNAGCTQSYVQLLRGAPTPQSQLASAITSYASVAAPSLTATDANPLALATQVCAFSSQLPSSLHSEFDAYATSVISYISASSSEINAVITNCLATGAEGSAYTAVVNSLATHTGPLCAATGAPNATITTGSPSPTSSGANGGASSSIPTGAAPHPTAFFGGAAAAIGVLGAAILL